MYITIVPSLKTILISKIASSFYYDRKIRKLERVLASPLCFLPNEDWRRIVQLRMSMVVPFDNLREDIVNLFKTISCEVVMWGYDHREVNRGFASSIHLWTCFKWNSLGIIDRKETAKRIVAKTSVSVLDRFLLACNYRMKEEIFELWGRLSEEQKTRVLTMVFSPIVTRWVQCLQKGSEPQLTELVEDFLRPRPGYSECNKSAGLRSLFPDLSKEDRLKCLMCSIEHRELHPDDLRYCLSQLDVDQQTEVFKKHSFWVLKWFLHWPLQDAFLDLADQMYAYLSDGEFNDLFHVLVCQIIMKGWEDYDYVSLLQDLWHRSPPHLRDFVKRTRFYSAGLRTVIEYQRSEQFPLDLLKDFFCVCVNNEKVIYME